VSNMEQNDVLRIFRLIASVYPTFIPTEDEDAADRKLNLWCEFLEDQDFNKVQGKVKRHIKTEKYPPTVAEIIDHAPKQETSFIDQLAEMRRNAASPEVAAMHKARIRELLNG
jgi:glutathione S-transferase